MSFEAETIPIETNDVKDSADNVLRKNLVYIQTIFHVKFHAR
jgi:hypothetical protein